MDPPVAARSVRRRHRHRAFLPRNIILDGEHLVLGDFGRVEVKPSFVKTLNARLSRLEGRTVDVLGKNPLPQEQLQREQALLDLLATARRLRFRREGGEETLVERREDVAQLLKSLAWLEMSVRAPRLERSGDFIELTTAKDKTIRLTYLQTGLLDTDLYGDPLPTDAIVRFGSVRDRMKAGITSLAYLPGSDLLIAGSRDAGVLAVFSREGKRIGRLALEGIDSDLGGALAFSPDNKRLAVPYEAGILVGDMKTKKAIRKIRCHFGLWLLLLSPDGKTVATGEGKIIERWDLTANPVLPRRPSPHFSYSPFPRDYKRIAFASDGETVAFASRRSWAVWDTATGRLLGRWWHQPRAPLATLRRSVETDNSSAKRRYPTCRPKSSSR